MINVFNSVFEVSLRILCILNENNKPISLERVYCLDFISTYAKDFGYYSINLHGNNNYNYSEFTTRIQLIKAGLKDLVLQGYVDFSITPEGLLYSISKKGKDNQKQMNDDYYKELSDILKKIISITDKKSDSELINLIENNSINARGIK